MIRLRYVHDEPHYIVRRPNGWSLSFPVRMTQATAAKIDIVREPQMALSALLELRRLATACLSSLPSSDSEGSQDATARGKTGHLFEENNSVHLAPLQRDVEEQVTRELVLG